LGDDRERGFAPSSLQAIAGMIGQDITVAEAVARITARAPVGARGRIHDKEACAALVVARDIGWIEFRGVRPNAADGRVEGLDSQPGAA
jgi:hypothetical protein